MLKRIGTTITIATVAALGLAACGGGSDPLSTASTGGGGTTSGSGGGGEVIVGSANFPENVLLAEIYAGALNAGGVKETVDDTVGQLSQSADPVRYAAAIEALFQRDIDEIGAAARARTVERFAWNRVFEDLADVYAEVSGERAFAGGAGRALEH